MHACHPPPPPSPDPSLARLRPSQGRKPRTGVSRTDTGPNRPLQTRAGRISSRHLQRRHVCELHTLSHNGDVTWVRCLKLPSDRLFIQQLVQSNNNETARVFFRHWPLIRKHFHQYFTICSRVQTPRSGSRIICISPAVHRRFGCINPRVVLATKTIG